MRSLMRSTAQATGRNPDIAQAMVDPRIHVEGVNDSGQVVTFTAQEAMKHGYCNAMAENIPGVLKKAGIRIDIIGGDEEAAIIAATDLNKYIDTNKSPARDKCHKFIL